MIKRDFIIKENCGKFRKILKKNIFPPKKFHIINITICGLTVIQVYFLISHSHTHAHTRINVSLSPSNLFQVTSKDKHTIDKISKTKEVHLVLLIEMTFLFGGKFSAFS